MTKRQAAAALPLIAAIGLVATGFAPTVLIASLAMIGMSFYLWRTRDT